MREEPTRMAPVSQVLTEGTPVEMMGESHQELNGNVWLKVGVINLYGERQIGWVDQRYVL
jgi:hypothetical protein